jgi:hypothetical protein
VVLDHDVLNGYGLMTLITFNDGKVLMRDGKVGTEQGCCCEEGSCCNDLDLNVLLYGDEPYSWPNVNPGGQPAPMYGGGGEPPQVPVPGSGLGSCKVVQACLRWVCIKFSATSEVIESAVYGGPTTNSRDLVELVIENEGPEQGGCWVYTVEFFGWKCYFGTYTYCPEEDGDGNCLTPLAASRWVMEFFPGDTAFSIYKNQRGG